MAEQGAKDRVAGLWEAESKEKPFSIRHFKLVICHCRTASDSERMPALTKDHFPVVI